MVESRHEHEPAAGADAEALSRLSREELCARVLAVEELKSEIEAQNKALRETQGSLEESRSRYADLYDFAPIPYFTFDKNGVVLEVNLTCAMLLGRNRSRLVGKPFLSLAQFADPNEFTRHLQRVLEATGPVTGEISLSMGRRHAEVQLVSSCVRNARGEPIACRTAMIDVTQQRAAEREARAAHTSEITMRRQLELIDRASATVTAAVARIGGPDLRQFLQVVVDEARHLVNADYAGLGIGGEGGKKFDAWIFSGMSDAMAAMIGRTPRGVGVLGAVIHAGRTLRLRDLSEHASFAGCPAHHPRMTSFLGVPIRYQGQNRGNLYLTNKRGAHEFSAEDQHVVEMLAERVGIALEIARLRHIERREHRRLELVARAGLILAQSLDYDATIDSIARLLVPGAADLCALDIVAERGVLRRVAVHHRDPTKDQLVKDLVDGRETVRLSPELWSSLERGRARRLDDQAELMRHLRGDVESAGAGPAAGEAGIHISSALVSPLVSRGGLLGVLTLALTDEGRAYDNEDIVLVDEIAHHATLALDSASLYRTAQTAVRSRDSLLAVVSHDLRNYLTTIRLSGRVLLREDSPREPSVVHKHVDSIIRSATRMDQLIATLHDATMIETGHFTVSLKPLDLASVLEEAQEMLEPQAEARGLRLTTQLETKGAGVALVRGDRDRLLQVIANLVSNAIKFTPTGGEIRLTLRTVDGGAAVSVRDTGRGMEADTLDHVFERHWKRGDEAQAGAGSGLGLYIVKGIVEAHDGRVDVASAAGSGTDFTFTLPLFEKRTEQAGPGSR